MTRDWIIIIAKMGPCSRVWGRAWLWWSWKEEICSGKYGYMSTVAGTVELAACATSGATSDA